jgi:hypothetical protein
MFSIATNIRNFSLSDCEFDNFLYAIRTGKVQIGKSVIAYKSTICEIRRPDIADNDRKKLKEKLPIITFSGKFSGGHKGDNFTGERSGYVYIDVDYKDNVSLIESLPTIFYSIPFIKAFWRSASGKGFSALAKIDWEKGTDNYEIEYRNAYNYIASLLLQWGIIADAACKNFSRCCYLSYDENITVVPDCDVSPLPYHEIPKASIENQHISAESVPIVDAGQLQSAIEFCRDNNICLVRNYDDLQNIAFAVVRGYSDFEQAFLILQAIVYLPGNGYPGKNSRKINPDFLRNWFAALATYKNKRQGKVITIATLYYFFRTRAGYLLQTEEIPACEVEIVQMQEKETLADYEKVISEKLRENKRIVIEAQTGVGKTYVAAKLINSFSASTFIAPLRLIAEQTANYSNMELCQAGEGGFILPHISGNCAVSTYSKFAKDFAISYPDRRAGGLYIIDEAHEIANSYTENFRKGEISKIEQLLTLHADNVLYLSGTVDYNYCAAKGLKVLKFQKQSRQIINFSFKLKSKGGIQTDLLKILTSGNGRVIVFLNDKSALVDLSIFLQSKGFDNQVITSTNKGKSAEYKYIAESGLIRTRVLLCTSVLDTGVNINNDDISDILYVESSGNFDTARIVQAASRVRKTTEYNLTIYATQNRFEPAKSKLNLSNYYAYFTSIARHICTSEIPNPFAIEGLTQTVSPIARYIVKEIDGRYVVDNEGIAQLSRKFYYQSANIEAIKRELASYDNRFVFAETRGAETLTPGEKSTIDKKACRQLVFDFVAKNPGGFLNIIYKYYNCDKRLLRKLINIRSLNEAEESFYNKISTISEGYAIDNIVNLNIIIEFLIWGLGLGITVEEVALILSEMEGIGDKSKKTFRNLLTYLAWKRQPCNVAKTEIRGCTEIDTVYNLLKVGLEFRNAEVLLALLNESRKRKFRIEALQCALELCEIEKGYSRSKGGNYNVIVRKGRVRFSAIDAIFSRLLLG